MQRVQSRRMASLVRILYVCMIGIHAAVCTHRRSFRSYPTTVKTYENDTVLLPCHVEDQGMQTRVRWWREEMLLADSGSESDMQVAEKVTLYANGSLQVRHVQREDSGEYVCQRIRPAPWGYVTQVHEIEVMYPPSVETVPASGELEVNLGEEVDMQCVAKGVPIPTISWRMKDKDIPLLDARSQLRFHASDRNLSGRYTCVATNEVDDAQAHINLRIRYKPEIYVKKVFVHAHTGIPAKLDCTVIAWPEAKVEWYFKNETLKYTSRVVKYEAGNDHTLLIRNVNMSDYGSYRCRASNSLGITEKTIELTAIANPAVFKKESRNASSTSYHFIWEVDSYTPIVEYQFWFRKYQGGVGSKWHKLFIPSGSDSDSPVHTHSFNLTGLDAATHYEAVVLSRNRQGWSYPSEILRFHTKGAPADYALSEDFEADGNQEQNRISTAQLASMSQHYPLAADAGSAYNQAKTLLLILGTLIIISISFNSLP